jgi:hypothetical protein
VTDLVRTLETVLTELSNLYGPLPPSLPRVNYSKMETAPPRKVPHKTRLSSPLPRPSITTSITFLLLLNDILDDS